MREIRFRYTYKRKDDGHIYQVIYPIEALEEGKTDTMQSNPLWDLIARDLFTGLQDKSGQDIYEGDIIKFQTASSELRHFKKDRWVRDVVRFEDGAFMPFFDMTYIDGEQGDYFDRETFEVIGNIYETPELLEQKP